MRGRDANSYRQGDATNARTLLNEILATIVPTLFAEKFLMSVLESPKVENLGKIVEESTRSTKEGVKYFIEPAPGTLARAKNKRHHIVFGRRGSGKSSLLAKVTADLTVNRSPIAYVDLEEFKGHSYPDVLLSVLIKTLCEFKAWMDSAAVHPSNRTSFWDKLFGASPSKRAFPRAKAVGISTELGAMI